jgi:hypothetical protein
MGMTKRKPKLPTSGQKKKQPNHRKPFAGVSQQTCGVKDRPLIEKGFGGVLDAALDVWAAKHNIHFHGQWRSKWKPPIKAKI